MTVNQTSINGSIEYNTFPGLNYGNSLNWWRKVRLAVQFIFNPYFNYTSPKFVDPGYIPHDIRMKERRSIDTLLSDMKFDVRPIV